MGRRRPSYFYGNVQHLKTHHKEERHLKQKSLTFLPEKSLLTEYLADFKKKKSTAFLSVS